jgi:membrane-associated phospholipid phosphatase
MTELARALGSRLSPTGFGARWALASLWALPLGLVLTHATVGLRPEHLALFALLLALTWAGAGPRRFLAAHVPFALAGLIYDLSRLVFSRRSSVHVGDLWAAERAVFGLDTEAGRVALIDLVSSRSHPALDLLCGAVYLLYIAQVFVTTTFLFFRDAPRATRLAWGFVAANLIGWTVWLIFPAAPPWYVDHYGLGPVVLTAASDPAGASRFDALVGAPIFASYYARSANVFGAMPSLHVAYATLPALVAWPTGVRWLRALTVSWALMMAFTAVYFRHHYILDVLAGVAVAALAERAVAAALGLVNSLAKRSVHPTPSEVWP